MKILVTGARGMLGTNLCAEAIRRGHEVVATDLPEFDIADPAVLEGLASGALGRFDWCVNAAAYTAVDRAESEEAAAWRANVDGPGLLAAACRAAGCRILHVSTDFVFDGSAREPIREDAPTSPLGVYGRTKLEGEERVFAAMPEAIVARTAWLYGPNGPSFPRTLIRAWLAEKPLRVVADQTGSPTYTADLARVLVELAERGAPGGVYHTAGPDAVTWRDLAEAAIQAYRDHVLGDPGRAVDVAPIRTEEWPTPARRPAYSVLSFAKTEALGIPPMRRLGEALADFVARLPDPV